MSSVNKMMILGNLTRDPELKTLPNGTKCCEFTIATSDRYTKDNQTMEDTEFHNMVAWNKQAEVIAQNKKKGDMMFVTAKKKTASWDDKTTGKKQYKVEFHVQEFEFIGSPKHTQPVQSSDNDLPFE
jgi:single-strand DNA-binding protein